MIEELLRKNKEKYQCKHLNHIYHSMYKHGPYYKSKLSWSRARANFCQLIASLFVILLHLNWQSSNLRFLGPTFIKKRNIWM